MKLIAIYFMLSTGVVTHTVEFDTEEACKRQQAINADDINRRAAWIEAETRAGRRIPAAELNRDIQVVRCEPKG